MWSDLFCLLVLGAYPTSWIEPFHFADWWSVLLVCLEACWTYLNLVGSSQSACMSMKNVRKELRGVLSSIKGTHWLFFTPVDLRNCRCVIDSVIDMYSTTFLFQNPFPNIFNLRPWILWPFSLPIFMDSRSWPYRRLRKLYPIPRQYFLRVTFAYQSMPNYAAYWEVVSAFVRGGWMRIFSTGLNPPRLRSIIIN